MPHASKRVRAAKAREAAKRLIRQSLQPVFILPEVLEVKSELKYNPTLPIEGGPSCPLEPTIQIDVKPEPICTESAGGGSLPLPDEVEVKEELLDPEESGPAESIEQDPIGGQDGLRLLLQSTEENEHDNRCQFCLKLFQESGGFGIITKAKVEFVLGLTKWGIPGRSPDCCEECRKMFDMFYEFKQGCLVALARPAEMFVWTEKKGSAARFVALKPENRTNPKSAKAGQPRKRNATKKPQVPKKRPRVKAKQQSLETKAMDTEALLVELQQDVKDAECAICNEKVSDGLALKQHMLKHYPPESLESDTKVEEPVKKEKKPYCGRCRKYFSAKELYEQHKPDCIENHKRNKPPPPEFACTMCPKKFTREIDLGYHINKHNGVRTIPCRREGCTKMFFTPSIRHNHEMLCGQEIQVICSMCGSIFRSKSALRIHMAIHGDPQFKCEICSKGFYTKANLKKHASAHSDERRFQCKVCGKRFKSHEANRVHQRIHTEEKPYVCHICGQRFTYNCLLKTHLEKGHDTVPVLPAMNQEVFPPNPFGGFPF